jgi:hypothetical protein
MAGARSPSGRRDERAMRSAPLIGDDASLSALRSLSRMLTSALI